MCPWCPGETALGKPLQGSGDWGRNMEALCIFPSSDVRLRATQRIQTKAVLYRFSEECIIFF